MIRDITVRVVAGVLVVLALLLIGKIIGVALVGGYAVKKVSGK